MDNLIIASTDKDQMSLWIEVLTHHYPLIFTNEIEMIFAQERQDNNRVLLVLDVNLIDQTNQLPLICQHIKRVVVVGENFTPDQQIRFIYEGACGYSEKIIDKHLILHTIKSVFNDDIWLTRQFVSQMLKKVVKTPDLFGNIQQTDNKFYKAISILTRREIEIVEHVFNGENNDTIAKQLNISIRMVKAHLSAVYRKLNVQDRFHLVVFLKDLNVAGKIAKSDDDNN